jgi:hypothetical protein
MRSDQRKLRNYFCFIAQLFGNYSGKPVEVANNKTYTKKGEAAYFLGQEKG